MEFTTKKGKKIMKSSKSKLVPMKPPHMTTTEEEDVTTEAVKMESGKIIPPVVGVTDTQSKKLQEHIK